MKSIFRICSLLFLASFMAVSCDVIEPPYTEGDPNINPTDTVVRKILLEDFTGHQCPNCPTAAVIAHELQVLYPGKISLVAIHSGYFADLASPNFMYDFTCTEGDDLYTAFGISNNPIGVINRTNTGTNNDVVLYDKDNWAPTIASLLAMEPEADINITSRTFNTGTNMLNLSAKIDFLADFSDPVYICAYLTEDSIIKPQKNADANVGTTPEILDYNHMHVLRGSMNGTWGEELTATASMNTSMTKDLSCTVSNADWDKDHMHVVVFIYNQTTGEVIQTEEIKLK